MSTLQRLALLGCLALWMTQPARSETESSLERLMMASLDELMSMPVSIASQSSQPVSLAPAVVTVISEEDMRATGAVNLVDVLQGVPGIHIRINHFGFRPLISMRGAAAKNALVMINGAPQRDLVWATGIFWKGLPVSMIERIEIIRGPGSALYGSDASSGVINVVTKTAGKMRGSEAGVRLDSFNTQTAWLEHGQEWNGLDVGLTLEASTTDGHRPYLARAFGPTRGHANVSYDNLDLRFSIGRNNWRILADHMQKDNYHIGFNGASYLDPVTSAKDRQTSIAWIYNNRAFAPGWGLDAEVRYRDLAYSSGNGFWEVPAIYLSQLRSAEQRFNAEASLTYVGFEGHALRFGGGYVWQDLYHVDRVDNGVATFFVPEQSRRNTYLFIQDAWQLAERWELTAGARYDRYSDVGSALNPRAALVWQTTDRLTSKLMVGKAFRAPSYLELYANTGATTPNINLQPEQSTTRELSFSYRASRDLNLSVNVFDYLQKNPIVDAGGTFQNVDPHRIRGIELEAVWQATQTLRLAGNLTTRRVDDAQYTRLRVPVHFSILTDTRTPLGAQTIVDTTLRYHYGSEWEFSAGIRNLFDKDAREYTGTRIPGYLPLPRRNGFVEVRYKF